MYCTRWVNSSLSSCVVGIAISVVKCRPFGAITLDLHPVLIRTLKFFNSYSNEEANVLCKISEVFSEV